jgi:hypothetical protein
LESVSLEWASSAFKIRVERPMLRAASGSRLAPNRTTATAITINQWVGLS